MSIVTPLWKALNYIYKWKLLKKKLHFRLAWWLNGKVSALQFKGWRFNPWFWKIPHAAATNTQYSQIKKTKQNSISNLHPWFHRYHSWHLWIYRIDVNKILKQAKEGTQPFHLPLFLALGVWLSLDASLNSFNPWFPKLYFWEVIPVLFLQGYLKAKQGICVNGSHKPWTRKGNASLLDLWSMKAAESDPSVHQDDRGELWETVEDRGAWHAPSPQGCKELDITQGLNNNKFHLQKGLFSVHQTWSPGVGSTDAEGISHALPRYCSKTKHHTFMGTWISELPLQRIFAHEVLSLFEK